MLSTEVTQEQLVNFAGRINSHFSELGDGEPCGLDCPAEHVTWNEAVAYANMLSSIITQRECYSPDPQGRFHLDREWATPYECPGFRLPTEAEWEFAARADTTTSTYAGDLESGHLGCAAEHVVLDEHAWFCGNSSGMTHPVGMTSPNDWGLFDMLGNVFEWCHDVYERDLGTATVENPFGPLPTDGARRVYRGGAWDEPAERQRSADRAGMSPAELRFIGFRLVRLAQ